MRRIMKSCIARLSLPVAVALLALAVLAAAVDAAFLIVALIVIFILAPTVMMFAYYMYALKPDVVMLGSGDVRVVAGTDCVTATVEREERNDYTISIPYSQLREIMPGDPHDIIVYGSRPDQAILIDKDAFADNAARIQFHNYIFDKIAKNK